ncbi:MAG: IS3 family transposase [Bacteroides sp.]|nr:IS3 family transposase [Bacteroides sp.]
MRHNIALYSKEFESPEAFMKALDEYIEYYNYKRIKSRCKSKSHTVYFKEKL